MVVVVQQPLAESVPSLICAGIVYCTGKWVVFGNTHGEDSGAFCKGLLYNHQYGPYLYLTDDYDTERINSVVHIVYVQQSCTTLPPRSYIRVLANYFLNENLHVLRAIAFSV